MKKIVAQKLSLKKETIQQLTRHQLGAAAGGRIHTFGLACSNATCPSWSCPPDTGLSCDVSCDASCVC